MDSSQSGLIKQVVLDPGDPQMMLKVSLHPLEFGCLKMASRHDPGGQRLGRPVGEFVDQIVLTGQDHRQIRFGVFFELTDGVQFGKYFQAH